MRLFAPGYYKQFKCIAERCTHSCCVGWEIDIDGQTLSRYIAANGGYHEEIKESIEHCEAPHFRLLGERCPHLDGSGLCKIITSLGEAWLCDICREHPRFYNRTCRGREVGLGLVCEHACRIILSYGDYSAIDEISSDDGEVFDIDFDAVSERDAVYGILSDITLTYNERLRALYKKYIAPSALMNDGEWRGILDTLEYLCDENKELFALYSSDLKTPAEYEVYAERFLAYLVYRHASRAECEGDFRALMGFCLFTERLFISVLREKMPTRDGVFEIARIISEEIEYSEDNTESIIMEFELA